MGRRIDGHALVSQQGVELRLARDGIDLRERLEPLQKIAVVERRPMELAVAPATEPGGEPRVVLRLHPRLAPYKVAVFPLVKKDGLPEAAYPLYEELSKSFVCRYDESGSVGRRYLRADVLAPAIRLAERLIREHGLEIPVVSTGQVFAGHKLWLTDPDAAKRRRAVEIFKGLVDVAARFKAMVNMGRVRGFIAAAIAGANVTTNPNATTTLKDGTTVNFPTVGRMAVGSYTKYTNVTAQDIKTTNETLVINQTPMVMFAFDERSRSTRCARGGSGGRRRSRGGRRRVAARRPCRAPCGSGR